MAHTTPMVTFFPRYITVCFKPQGSLSRDPLRYLSTVGHSLGTTEDGGRLGKVEGEEEAMHCSQKETQFFDMHAQYVM